MTDMFGNLPVRFVYEAWEREKEAFPNRHRSFQPQALDKLEDIEAISQIATGECSSSDNAPPSLLTAPRLAWLSGAQEDSSHGKDGRYLMLAVATMLQQHSPFYDVPLDLLPQCL